MSALANGEPHDANSTLILQPGAGGSYCALDAPVLIVHS